MHVNNSFKLKLIFPCTFQANEPFNPFTFSTIYHLPYGMGILTALLRKHNYYVEQEDLSIIKFNRYGSVFLATSIFRNLLTLIFKNINDLDIWRHANEVHSFLKSNESKNQLNLLIDKIFTSTSVEEFNVIGFSIFTFFHFIFALMLSKKIKQRTHAPIVFGGPFISLYGKLYPEVFEFIDYMIVNDGGIPLLRLIDYLKHKISIFEVPNLIYRDNGNLITNPKAHYPIEDMPMPDFDGLPLHLYRHKYNSRILFPYQISRGCTSRCSFCVYICIDNKLEFKSYDKVLHELRQMKEKYKIKISPVQ